MKIRDVMSPDIEVVTPEDTLTTAARVMADLDFEAVPVGDNNKLVGMITAHDIAVGTAVDGFDPQATAVHRAMTTDLLYCFENESADDVAQKMAEWWVRRLPVVNHEKRLIGMVSLADLATLGTASRPREGQMHSHRPRAPHSAQTRRPRSTAAAA